LDTTIAELSPQDLEELIANAIDRRMQVWLTQLLDAVGSNQEEQAEMLPEFENSLQRAINQALMEGLTPLDDFRRQLLDE
jgi:hypothetical protein